MAKTEFVIACSEVNSGKRISTWVCVKARLILISVILCIPTYIYANPWLPEPAGWKYSFQYSKYTTPKSIKFYERDLYFALDKTQALLYKELAQSKQFLNTEITNRKSALVLREQNNWFYLSNQEKQIAKDTLFEQDPDLQILYDRARHREDDTNHKVKYLKDLQEYLILSYHNWSATTNVEYGFDNKFSYGVSIGKQKEVSKFNDNKNTDTFSLFFKAKLYDYKGYIFTVQPKFLTIGPVRGANITAMLGKSHIMKRKLLGKEVEVFGYSSFGVTQFLDSNIIKKQMHAEITSGIKWNDSTILINQEAEEFNPELSKTYKRVLRSQFTIAQDINFANIEPRNKVYLTLSYFSIDSIKAKRRLSSGYSVGLWLEL